MSEITLDAVTAAAIAKSPTATRVCDPDGRTVGYVMPAGEYEAWRKAMYDQAFAEITEEDVRRALADPRRHTTDEVFKLLEGE